MFLITKEYEKLGHLTEEYRKQGKPFNFFHFMVALDGGPCLNKRLRGWWSRVGICGDYAKKEIFTPVISLSERTSLKWATLEASFDPSVGRPLRVPCDE